MSPAGTCKTDNLTERIVLGRCTWTLTEILLSQESITAEKEEAVSSQDFERAAALRDKEKELKRRSRKRLSYV